MEGQATPRPWPTLATIGLSVLTAGIVVFWGAQDKQGKFQWELLTAEPRALLFFAGPYSVLAACACFTRRDVAASRGTLFVAAVLALLHLAAHWVDHLAYLRTPPGRETAPMTSFLTTILLWLGVLAQVVVLAVRRIVGRRRSP
jgi:hypothetical protein